MLLDLIFHHKPFICPGCMEPARELVCEICRHTLRHNHRMILPKTNGIRGIFPIFISYSTTHQLLAHWKDHPGEKIRSLLFTPSENLKAALCEMRFDCIIPIPQLEARSLKRGHASAFEVAKFFGREIQVPVRSHLSLKKGPQLKQANLNEWERMYGENPFEFRTHEKITGSKILLADDFITTGSTLEKAANALLDLNPNLQIWAVALGWKPKTVRRPEERKGWN